jgi:uncharacterized protein (DUF934 family)
MPERVIRFLASGAAQVQPELWNILSEEQAATTLPAGPVVVPLATWRARRSELNARREPVGVWLKPDDEPGELAGDFATIALIAIHFPKFTDGRGYSSAVLLRTRLGYKGELRAFGDVGRDQLFYLKRCGFDSFSLPEHRDPEGAIASFDDFSLRYQGSVDDPAPLFRKRFTTGATR